MIRCTLWACGATGEHARERGTGLGFALCVLCFVWVVRGTLGSGVRIYVNREVSYAKGQHELPLESQRPTTPLPETENSEQLTQTASRGVRAKTKSEEVTGPLVFSEIGKSAVRPLLTSGGAAGHTSCC